MMKNRMSFAIAAASRIIALAVLSTCFASVCRAAHPADCSSIPHGLSCSLEYNVGTVTVLDDMVLVGTANHLFSFGRDLSSKSSVSMDPQSDKYARCTSFDQGGLSNPESECQNFIRVIQEVPSGFETNAADQRQVMVCGTNAFFPKCTIHEASRLSNYSYMTSEEDDEGYSPHKNEDPIVALLTSNGRFFSATQFTAFQPHRTIGMSTGPLSGDSLFRVKAPIFDPLWFFKPEFVSTYEINDHVYFFMREPAYEVDDGNTVVYSRAIRICKNDNGQAANVDDTPFLTYQKAQMVCSYSGERGSIPYNYDNLESTFLWNGGNGGALTLYAIFSSPNNGPQGSAICKFSFDPNTEGSLTKVFEDGQYTIPATQNGQQVWITEEPGPFSCPGSTSGVQRTLEQANTYQLIDSPVEASDPEPLYVVSGVKLDKITADVISFNGQEQEVIYFTSADGELWQTVYAQDSTTQDHLIRDVGSAVSYLSVHRNADETRQVYVTTEDRIMTISRGDCAQYSSCFKCLDSRDAYCGWSSGANTCVNKLRENPSDLTESLSASEEETVALCGTRPAVSNPPPVAPSDPCPFPSSPGSSGVCEPDQGGLSGSRNASESEMNVPTIVGATVGAFVLGVPVGAFVCFIFFRMFVRPRRSKSYDLEEENHVTRQSNANGISRMSNIPNGESSDSSTQNREKKTDLSLSMNGGPQPSLRPPGPPRYVDVTTSKSQLSSSVPSGSNGSALPTSIRAEMMYKHNSCVDISGGMLSKKDCSFGGSENDLVPPLVQFSGHEGYGGTHKKSPKPTKFAMPPTGANGVSRTQVPGYKVPKGRTPSTTWLRENSISECSDLSSPLQSPISDV